MLAPRFPSAAVALLAATLMFASGCSVPSSSQDLRHETAQDSSAIPAGTTGITSSAPKETWPPTVLRRVGNLTWMLFMGNTSLQFTMDRPHVHNNTVMFTVDLTNETSAGRRCYGFRDRLLWADGERTTEIAYYGDFVPICRGTPASL